MSAAKVDFHFHCRQSSRSAVEAPKLEMFISISSLSKVNKNNHLPGEGGGAIKILIYHPDCTKIVLLVFHFLPLLLFWLHISPHGCDTDFLVIRIKSATVLMQNNCMVYTFIHPFQNQMFSLCTA